VLVGELFYAVVERGGADLAPEERLADEVERVRSAAEAPVGGIETVLIDCDVILKSCSVFMTTSAMLLPL
jgi:hypothetical protein